MNSRQVEEARRILDASPIPEGGKIMPESLTEESVRMLRRRKPHGRAMMPRIKGHVLGPFRVSRYRGWQFTWPTLLPDGWVWMVGPFAVRYWAKFVRSEWWPK